MHKIFVPVDGSDYAMRAVEYAIKVALERGPAEVNFVTVYPEPVIYGEIQVYTSPEKMEEELQKHGEDVQRPAVAAAEKAGVTYTAEIVIGDTAEMIAKRADELGCDSIIMGTHGRGAIGSLVMGSIATKVVHLAKVPVTLVK